MANNSDGKVIIDTELNTAPLEASVKDVKTLLTSASGAVTKFGDLMRKVFVIPATEPLEKQAKNTRVAFEALSAVATRFGNVLRKYLVINPAPYTAGSEEVVKSTEQMEQELKDLEEQIKKTQDWLDFFKDEEGNYKKGSEQIEGFSQNQANLQNMLGQYNELQAEMQNVTEAQDDVTAGEGEVAEGANGWAFLLSVVKKVGTAMGKVAKSALKASLSLAKMVGRGIINGFKKLGSAIHNVFSGLHKSNGGFSVGFKNILKYGLGIRSLFVLFNRLRNALVEGMKTLAEYDSETNNSISRLHNAFGQLKNAFAGALAPLFNLVAPAIDAIVTKLTAVIDKIAQFFSALTGKKTYMRATRGQYDYAKSLDKTAESAKKATTYLSGLDEVQRYTSEKDESSGDTSGVEGGFEEVAIDSKLAELANKLKAWIDKIKGFFNAKDWEGLGSFVADGINGLVQKIYDLVNWDNVGPKITEFVDGFCRTFNALVDGIDWEMIGRTIGAGFNTLLHTIDLFFKGIDWKNLGASLAEGLNGLIDEIDWALVGETISDGIKSALDFVNGWLETFDWYGFGKGISDAIDNIDWEGISERFFEGVGAIVGGLGAFIIGLLEDEWQEVVDWWYDTAYEDGEFTMEGLLLGIWEKIKDIGQWIVDHIFTPFKTGFEKAFRIGSPSKEMEDEGGWLMEGLFNGITAWIQPIVDLFTGLKDKISGVWDGVNSDTTTKWEGIKSTVQSAVDSIVGIVDSMKSRISSLVTDITTKIRNIDVSSIGSIGIYGASLGNIKIPHLASGTVIPPNAPFMAMLGDQKSGTNIEAPLDTIKQAVAEVLGGNAGGQYKFTAQINRRTIFEEVIEEARLTQATTGRNPFDLVRA